MTNVDRTPRNPNLLRWHSQPVPDRPRRGAVRVPRARIRSNGPGGRSPRSATTSCWPGGARSRRPTRAWRQGRPGGRGGARARRRGPTATPYAEFLATPPREPARRGRRRPSVPGRRSPFQYAALRVVPRVERGEAVNAGVVLFCRPLRFLGARTHLDEALLAALVAEVRPDRGQGAAEDDRAHRARRAAGRRDRRSSRSPSASTGWSRRRARSCRPGPVHTGLTSDPQHELDKLFAKLVER